MPDRPETISPTSQKLQAVGQRILGDQHIVEATENIFSTCQVPLERLSDRLMLARDFGAPLVEATVFPRTDQYAAVSQLFGVSNRLVKAIVWSDGKQREDRYMGDHIRYDRMALDLEEDENIQVCGDSGTEIKSYIISSFYSIEDLEQYTLGMSYEDWIVHGYMPTDDPRIDLELDRALKELERFDAARTPDGYWR